MHDGASRSLTEPHVALTAKSSGKETMQLKVYSPFKVFFDESATSVSAQNGSGAFDILPQHHKFITILEPCELVICTPNRTDKQRIKISGGLMHVTPERVVVFLDI